MDAIDKAVKYFKATCTGKDIAKIKPVHRQHKHAYASSIETTTGLLAMQERLKTYTIGQFHDVVGWMPEAAWH